RAVGVDHVEPGAALRVQVRVLGREPAQAVAVEVHQPLAGQVRLQVGDGAHPLVHVAVSDGLPRLLDHSNMVLRYWRMRSGGPSGPWRWSPAGRAASAPRSRAGWATAAPPSTCSTSPSRPAAPCAP